MIKKLITLFKLGRKIAKSEALKVISKTYEPPLLLKIIANTLSFTFSKNTEKKIIKTLVYLSLGQESIAASVSEAFKNAYVFFQHRGHAQYLCFNGNEKKLADENNSNFHFVYLPSYKRYISKAFSTHGMLLRNRQIFFINLAITNIDIA